MAQVHMAQVAVVPNVAAAMLCASDAPATRPPTTCDGRSNTRMSRIEVTHACAATKWAIARRQRAGAISAAAAHAVPIAPTAHGPNMSPSGGSITVSAVPTSSAASSTSAQRARRAFGVTTRRTAPHSGVPM